MNFEEKSNEEIINDFKDSNFFKLAQFKPVSLDKIFSMNFLENKWVIETLIPYQCITLLSGAPASFKTWLLLEMAINVASGRELFGQFKCEKSNVLVIDEENHLRLVKERMTLLKAGDNLPIYYLSQKGFLVSDEKMIKKVLAICEEKKIGIIFIDSLVRINRAEENSANGMAEVFRSIKTFCQKGVTVVITHHERKENFKGSSAQNRLRGSSDIQAAVDCHISVSRDKNNRDKILVEQAKLREGEEMEPFELEKKNNEGGVEFVYLGSSEKNRSQGDLAKKGVIVFLRKNGMGVSIGEIVKKIQKTDDVGEKSIRQAIKDLVIEGRITETKGKGNSKICYLIDEKTKDK